MKRMTRGGNIWLSGPEHLFVETWNEDGVPDIGEEFDDWIVGVSRSVRFIRVV